MQCLLDGKAPVATADAMIRSTCRVVFSEHSLHMCLYCSVDFECISHQGPSMWPIAAGPAGRPCAAWSRVPLTDTHVTDDDVPCYQVYA